MYFSSFLIVACLASEVLSSSIISPCKASDLSCIEKSVNAAIPQIITGIPELGVPSSDPLFYDMIEGNLEKFKYKFYNTTVTGFKDCTVSNLKISEDLTKLQYNQNCQKFIVEGIYNIDGLIFMLPMKGNGDFKIITGKYLINMDCDMNKIQGSDGKNHLTIENFKFKYELLTPFQVDFKNLYDGQKELTDAAYKYFEKNWKAVSNEVEYPMWEVFQKRLINNVNEFLKNVALEDLILN